MQFQIDTELNIGDKVYIVADSPLHVRKVVETEIEDVMIKVTKNGYFETYTVTYKDNDFLPKPAMITTTRLVADCVKEMKEAYPKKMYVHFINNCVFTDKEDAEQALKDFNAYNAKGEEGYDEVADIY